MLKSRSKVAIALIVVAFSGLALTGCAGGATVSSGPADLVGEWKQSNNQSEDSYQAATITANDITVYWVSDGGDTKSLYWAGTYEPPTEPGSFSWASENDTEQTDSALLASGDATKKFTYENEEISYEVTALGTTTTVRLSRE